MATARRPLARPPVDPEAVREAWRFPALEAVFGRRSRRFALGNELTGPLAYRSDAEPVPLARAEQALLVAAATGVTGPARDDWPFRDADGAATGGDKLGSFTGRSWPSPLATHGTELFFCDDEGTYVLPQRDVRPQRYLQLRDQGEADELLGDAIQLLDHRLALPRARPNLFAFNHWSVNVEGSTLFMPVSDVTRQCISAMLLYFDAPHRYYVHDPRLGGDPLRPFVREGLIDDSHPVDLWDFERWQMVDMNGVEQGLMLQNLLVATGAMGLGGFPFSGGKGRVTMGGAEHWEAIGGHGEAEGLGFTFHRVPHGAPVGAGESLPVGLAGIFEGAVPPFHASLDDAVDALVARRFGPTGIFSNPEANGVGPWRSWDPARQMPRPSDWAVEATKAMCRYIWDSYGRFPATIDPMLMTAWYQAHHLDLAFYDRYYPPEAVPAHVRGHMQSWHHR